MSARFGGVAAILVAGALALLSSGGTTFATSHDSGPESGPAPAAPAAVGPPPIAVGGNHTCALPGDGTVICWGDNTFGQIGNGRITDPHAPAGDVLVQQIVLASGSSAAGGDCVDVVADGSVLRCHGSASLTGVTAIAAGFSHTCALLADATVKCWGSNAAIAGSQFGPGPRSGGELGDGTTKPRPTPVTVVAGPNQAAPLSDVRALTAANGYTCAVIGDGTAKCWGDTPQGASLTPKTVMADGTHLLTQILSISAGDTLACALLADGSVVCWGTRGMLGDQSAGSSTFPVHVTVAGSPAVALSGIAAISAGHAMDLNENGIAIGHSCALASDASVLCWGVNDASQLGNGMPNQVEAGQNWAGHVIDRAGSSQFLGGVTAIASGNAFTCALLAGETVRCWGLSYGAPVQGVGAPVVVPDSGGRRPLGKVVGIAAGGQACALISDGSIACWTGDALEPVTVPGLKVIAPAPTPTPAPTPAVTATPAASPAPFATDADALVGDWNVTYGSQSVVAIAFSNGKYSVVAKGLVRVPGSSCYLPSGTLLATFSGSGGSYAGQHALWRTSDCAFGRWTPMAATLSGDRLTARLTGAGRVVFTRSGITATALAFRESVATPAEITFDPAILIQSIVLALAFVVLIPFPGALFDSTLEANYQEVMGWGRSARRRLRRIARWSGAPTGDSRAETQDEEGWRTPPRLALALLIGVLLGCLLDPTFGLDLTSAATFVGVMGGLLVTLLVFGLPQVMAYRSNREHAHSRGSTVAAMDAPGGWDPYIRALPAALVVGIACVLMSRLTDFQPGYLYGLIIGVTARNQLTDVQTARAATIATVVMLVVAAAAWFALGWATALAPSAGVAQFGVISLQTALATVMVAGLQGALFGLLPLRFFPGGKIKNWNLWVWGGLSLVALLGFWHVLVNPTSGYLADSSRTPLVTIVGLLLFFGIGSVAFWAYFRYRRPPTIAQTSP